MAVVEWKLANPEAALRQLSNDPLGSSSLDHKPVGIELESNLSMQGDDAGRLSLNIRGQLTVAVLNDPQDPDEDGVVGAAAARSPVGELPPQISVDDSVAYLKFRAEAGMKASAGAALAQLVSIDAAAGANVVFADYRIHPRHEQARTAFVFDLTRGSRFATRLSDVQDLAVGEALAFRFDGSLHAAIELRWSDVFTGQLGSLGRLLGTATPIALSVKAGASVGLDVSVEDEFVCVFSRVTEHVWRTALRKVKSSRVAPTVDAGINVGFAQPQQIERLLAGVLESALGAPLEAVRAALDATSPDMLSGPQRKIIAKLIERFGLDDEAATLKELRQRVADAERKVRTTLSDVVRTRVALGFSYEYNRISVDTSLLQATLDAGAIATFHQDLIRARTQPVTEAISSGTPGMTLEMYLNQKELTRSHSWGFTLGLGKWAKVGGRDFKKITTVRRTDLQGRVQESYLGARSYKGQWLGESFEWSVDVKADMKAYAAEPLVSDYSFGMHIVWIAKQKSLSGAELEEWLDTAVIWKVLRERDLADVRGQLARAIDQTAELRVHLTIPNSVVRAMLPELAAAPADAFAPSLAAAMPWMKQSPARSNAERRRQVYAPLWRAYLANPARSQASLATAAFEHVKQAGHPEMGAREVTGAHGPDPFSFAGLARLNGNTRGACDAFTRGMRVLQTAIASGARNQKTIDKALGELDDLWAQSHHVRTIGAYLTDAADRSGVLDDVTRAMTIETAALPDSFVVSA